MSPYTKAKCHPGFINSNSSRVFPPIPYYPPGHNRAFFDGRAIGQPQWEFALPKLPKSTGGGKGRRRLPSGLARGKLGPLPLFPLRFHANFHRWKGEPFSRPINNLFPQSPGRPFQLGLFKLQTPQAKTVGFVTHPTWAPVARERRHGPTLG